MFKNRVSYHAHMPQQSGRNLGLSRSSTYCQLGYPSGTITKFLPGEG